MFKKIIFLIVIFYFLTIFQVSFLPHFNWQGIAPNLVLIMVVIFNLLEKPEGKLGLISGFLGGIFLDVFSFSTTLFFGFYTLISLVASVFIKFILRKYVQIPFLKEI